MRPNIYIPPIADLADNHARSLQQALLQAALESGVYTAKEAQDLVLARSNVNVESVVTAMGIHGLYRWLRDYIARQAVPIWATGEFLDGWLATYGMSRKAAVSAQGVITGTGTAGAWLTKDNQLQTDAGTLYQVTADVQVAADGTVTATVVSMDTGTAQNTSANAKLTMVASTAGINASFISTAGISGGTDTEKDSEAVYRLVQRLSNEPMGGAPHDYARWALACPGITRAWGVRNPAGATSAGVIIMADNNPDGLPTAEQRQAVYDYIRDPKRGPPDELFVIIPTLLPIDVTLDLTPDTAAIRAAVKLELQDLFFREAVPNYSMPHSHLIESVSIATGEHTHRFVSPVLTSGEYFHAGEYGLLTLGTVSFV
jgi:uncharacterized phage protein gp47/JayE